MKKFLLTLFIAFGCFFAGYSQQYARPNEDISTGSWTTSTGTSYFALIDEVTPADGDYVRGTNGAGTLEVKLSSVTDPGVGTGHILRVRIESTGSGAPEKIDIDLYQGTTLIENVFINLGPNRGSYVTESATLANADNITDYSDLRIRFIEDTFGNGENVDISWAELEVPEAAGSTWIPKIIISGD